MNPNVSGNVVARSSVVTSGMQRTLSALRNTHKIKLEDKDKESKDIFRTLEELEFRSFESDCTISECNTCICIGT